MCGIIDNIPTFWFFFEPLLEAIIHTGTKAAIVLDVVESRNAADHLPWLYTELQRKVGGNQAWERSARRYYKKNRSVASSLLTYYEVSNKAEFARIAGELWRNGLFLEKRYPEALRFADVHCNRWNLRDILEPCLIYQPHKALLMLEAKIEELLEEERGRDFYQRVAWVLLFASDTPEIREDAAALIVRLDRKYSRLRAFRSELRNAGLMDG
ncbi:hypothetical protein [Lunatimonas salinarum]|uniref:hypothetical protein n=1 Tax=Lunatimonas salinarum TaxID=1774590 RepID=UPI001ADF0344|nr:hypothetical protein [Lunatimonas salinarum]